MGKLVVFWSLLHGQAKVTANMSAVACLLNNDTQERVIMTHSQFGMADLEGMFNFRMEKEKSKAIYNNAGLSALLLRIKQSWLTEDIVEQCLMPVSTSSGLYLLPGTEEQFDILKASDTEELVYALLGGDIEKYYEWVMVDASAGNNPLSLRLLDAADVIVINLSQNIATWDKFLHEYPQLAKKKNVIFVIGGYDDDSRYNRRNIARMYNLVNGKNLGVVPNNTAFLDAISDGAVAKYIFSNENAKKGEENYDLISECRAISSMIRDVAQKGEK